jgi:hypothetical protein
VRELFMVKVRNDRELVDHGIRALVDGLAAGNTANSSVSREGRLERSVITSFSPEI